MSSSKSAAAAAAAAGASSSHSPSNSYIVHRIDPDHYKANVDADAAATPADTPYDRKQRDEPQRRSEPKQTTVANPSPPPAAAATEIIPLASVSKRAVKEASSGLGGSLFSACCVYPIDFVKTRIQLPNSPYTSIFGGMAQIWREEGFSTLYTGLGSELVKCSVQSFSYFYWYYVFKELATKRRERQLLLEEDLALSADNASKQNALIAVSGRGSMDLSQHQATCQDTACFCRSVGHLAAHTEAHKLKSNQVDIWCTKAELFRRKYRHQHPPPDDFETNPFHPRLMPSVSEPHLVGLQGKHDLDDSPYVDIKSADQTALVTNTATVIASPAPASSASPPPCSEPAAPQLSIAMTLLMGTFAGCITQLLVNPLSVVQTRMMTQKKILSGSGAPANLGFWGITMNILQTEGPSAFFAGILPALILSTNPSIQFLVFDRLKLLLLRVLSQSGLEPRSLSVVESFILGAFSKVVATLVTYPYILAKLRLSMAGAKTSSGANPAVVYRGTLDVIFRTLKYDGVTGLFVGLQAQLLKSVLGTALMFVFKEKLADLSTFVRKWIEQYRLKQQKQIQPPPQTASDLSVARPVDASAELK